MPALGCLARPHGEVAFRQGSAVTAVSPSGGGPLTYTGWVDVKATGSLMMRGSLVPFGSGALFRRACHPERSHLKGGGVEDDGSSALPFPILGTRCTHCQHDLGLGSALRRR